MRWLSDVTLGDPGGGDAVDDLPDSPLLAANESTHPAVRLSVLTRLDCHLCEVAKQQVAEIAQLAGVGWQEVDVDADPELQAEFWDRVPVVLLDGREHSYWRVDRERLLRDLRQ